MRKYLLILLVVFSLSLFSSDVSAQTSKPSIVIEHITNSPVSQGDEPKPNPDVDLVNTVRPPTINDVKDAMKDGKKVTVVISLSNDTARWAHAVRVVSINLTSYNGTNVDNQTTMFYDSEIYDPTTNTIYNLTFSHVYNDPTGFLQWGPEWAVIRDVITVRKLPPLKPGKHYMRQYDFLALPLIYPSGIISGRFSRL